MEHIVTHTQRHAQKRLGPGVVVSMLWPALEKDLRGVVQVDGARMGTPQNKLTA